MKFSVTDLKKVAKPAVERLFEGDKTDDQNEMFQSVIKAFKYKFICWDLSHMHFVWSNTPRTHDGDAKTDQADVMKYTGSWTKWDTIYIREDMTEAIKFYGLEGKVSAEDLQKQAIAHELAHEIWEYQIDDTCKNKILKKAADLNFDTPYLHHIDDDDKDEEMFCEYLAYRITGIWIKCEQSSVKEGVQTTPVEKSTEGFVDRVAYAFSSEGKIAGKLGELKTKLGSVDPKEFGQIKMTTYNYKQMLDIVKTALAVAGVSKEALSQIKKYISAFDNDEFADEDGKLWSEVTDALAKAGNKIKSQVKNVQAIWDMKKESGDLSTLGFTTANVKSIITIFEKQITEYKKVYSELQQFNSDVDMPAAAYGSENLTSFMNAVAVADRSFKIIDLFLFTLGRKIK